MKFIRLLGLAFIVMGFGVATSASAALVQFDLQGTAGFGLLFGNEPAVASGGSGGEIGTGITFDDTTGTPILRVNVGWGSANGFTNLSSPANNSHIHVTAANFGNDGTGNFKQTGGVLFTLARTSNNVDNGTIIESGVGNTITLTAPQVSDLFNGRYYVNVHTTTNGGGEIRGFITAVPEPTSMALMMAGGMCSAFVGWRRRRARA